MQATCEPPYRSVSEFSDLKRSEKPRRVLRTMTHRVGGRVTNTYAARHPTKGCFEYALGCSSEADVR